MSEGGSWMLSTTLSEGLYREPTGLALARTGGGVSVDGCGWVWMGVDGRGWAWMSMDKCG